MTIAPNDAIIDDLSTANSISIAIVVAICIDSKAQFI